MLLRGSPGPLPPDDEVSEDKVSEDAVTDADVPIRTDPVEIMVAFRRFWPLTKGDRGWFILIFLCAVVAAVAETITVLLFAELTDTALRDGSVSAFWRPAGQWLAAAVVGAVTGYLGNSLAVWAAERFVLRLRARVFSHLQTLPPHFFQQNRRGDLVERLTGDVEAIEALVVSGIVGAASALFSAVFYAAAALWLRWDLALATLLMVPLFWFTTRRFAAPLRTVSRRGRAADGAITSVVEETLVNVVMTQAYNRRRDEEERLLGKAQLRLRTAVRSVRLTELYEQLVEVLEALCVLTIIGLGTWEISAGRMTLGQLLAFAAFVGYLYPPIRSLGQLGLTATAATAGAERLLEILDSSPAVTDPDPAPTAPARARAVGRIEADRIGFHYPGGSEPVVRDLSFSAGPGELVVVTGPSGAGKSTLAALLLRFYDPDVGTIRLDGVPIDRLPLTYLRQNITLLPQQTLVLHDTIEHNIACGRPDATRHDVVAAARAADADGFVRALPDGYDTVISTGTARLSGGQLQRIAIARAMLRDAPVLLLDEPTTGLDRLAAHRIITPLRRLARGRTTIVITHDLALASDADRILVLDRGRFVETGTHAQLLSRKGLYATLFERLSQPGDHAVRSPTPPPSHARTKPRAEPWAEPQTEP